MRDGTQVALDVTLPSSFREGDKLATILRQTRYFRSYEMPRPLAFRASRDAFDIVAPTRERFLARGYAWVDVDVRGSGVSSGSWPLPWSRDEVKDGGEVVDYIVRQPWSNGLVGSTGVSYEGTTSEMLLVNNHDAVRAVAPRFSLFCAYEDVAFPGGAHLDWFTERWARYNRLLDDHRVHEAMAELVYVIACVRTSEPGVAWTKPARSILDRVGPERAKWLISAVFSAFLRGGRRVDEDRDGAMRARALVDHAANGDVHALCLRGSCRDDSTEELGDLGFSSVSPRGNLDAIRSSSAEVFGYGGWFDGAYGLSATRRFASLGRSRLLLGPWGHAGFFAHEPGRKTVPASFPHDVELLRFFDAHLRRELRDESDVRGVRYFTLVENRWRTASTWPPERVRVETLELDTNRRLVSHREGAQAAVALRDDPRFGTGERSRWRGLLAGFVPADYPDFHERTVEQVLFVADPFERGAIVTGHPTLRLDVRAAGDFTVMAYLVDIAPNGRRTYVTEGQLRAMHRREIEPEPAGYVPLGPCHSYERRDASILQEGERGLLAFGLLPTSYWFKPGHRVGLVLTLGDRDHFATVESPASSVDVLPSGSTLALPFEPQD